MATELWAGLGAASSDLPWQRAWLRLDELELRGSDVLTAQACGWPPSWLDQEAHPALHPAAFLRLSFSHVMLADSQGRELAGAGPSSWTLALADLGCGSRLSCWWGRMQAQWQAAGLAPAASQRRHLWHLPASGQWTPALGRLGLDAKGEDEVVLSVLAWRWDWHEDSRLFPLCQC